MRIDDEDLPPPARFGALFAVIFLALGGWWLFTGWMAGALPALGLGLATGLLARFRPDWLRGPNMAWALLGLVLGKIVGTAVLGLIFVTLITPLALLFRLTGRDELRLRRGAQQSYWRARDDTLAASRFSDQF